MKMIIPTCDNYINLLSATKYTFDKNGGDDFDVTVLGFKEPTFDMGSWKFISLGVDVGPQNLSNDLWKFFETFEDEFFIFHGDDGVILDKINTKLLVEMEQMMIDNPSIMKINLTSAFGHHNSHYKTFKDMGDYQYKLIPQDGQYRLSLNPSIWRTSYFKKYCNSNVGHWVWETRDDAKNDGEILLGVSGNYVLDIGHVFRYGNMTLSPNWFRSEYTNKQLSDEDKGYCYDVIKEVIKNKK